MSWAEINRRIADALRSAAPAAALSELFDSTKDGHVAFALAEQYELAGDVRLARAWFEVAEDAYPLSDFKKRARDRAARLPGSGAVGPPKETPAMTQNSGSHSTQLGFFNLAKPGGTVVFEADLRCPTCGTRLRGVVYRNVSAASDKVPAFFIGTDEQAARIGHLFVGRSDGPAIYYGEFYHCGEPFQTRAFFNRGLRSSRDPVLILVRYREAGDA